MKDEFTKLGDAASGVVKALEVNMLAKQSYEVVAERAPTAPAPPSESDAVLAMIERAARDPSVDIEKFERLMAMRERMEGIRERANQRAAQAAFSAAISEAKGEIAPITRNAEGHNKKKYADFGAIARAIDPILAQHGLSYRFRSTQTDKISVTCILSHRDGHSEENSLSGSPDASGSKNAIQAIGSTLTYLQRYSLVLSLGLASTEDDDGRKADQSNSITEEQAGQLRKAALEARVDMDRFLDFFKAEDIESIPAASFEKARTLLEARRARAMEKVS